jgi:hypothetical protein
VTRVYRPISRPGLVDELAEIIAARPVAGAALRVAVDGASATEPTVLARDLIDPLRERGRPVTVITAETFWRDASLRLEYGREDPESYLQWLDAAALRREVLEPLGPGGSGLFLPSLRDPLTNRATRVPSVAAAPGAVVIVAGPLLLGRDLPFDLTVHLALSSGALERRTETGSSWTLDALASYEADVRPADVADIVVRADDPARLAVSA